MFFFILIVVLLIFSIIGSIILYNRSFYDWWLIPLIFAIIFTIIFIYSIGVFICNGTDSQVAKANVEAERAIIVYQIEQRQDSSISVNELLYSQIRDFNSNVRTNKYYLNNPWTSWYTPSFWNEIELINYEGS